LGETTIAEARRRHETELLALPNVTGGPVIKVFVTEKVPESELAPEQRVPSHLDGFEVDVEAIGFVQAQQSEEG
jgi:hypothetical protein